MRNFAYYNFCCWIIDFEPWKEEDWVTSGLFNIPNGINIANLWPIYAAIRAELKNCTLRNFAFYSFCYWILDFVPWEEDWATSGLFNILNGINIANLWPIYAVTGAQLKNCILRNFSFYNFSENIVFQQLKEDWPTLQLLNMPHGIITITKFICLKIYLRKTVCRAIISEICILRIFTFYNFC